MSEPLSNIMFLHFMLGHPSQSFSGGPWSSGKYLLSDSDWPELPPLCLALTLELKLHSVLDSWVPGGHQQSSLSSMHLSIQHRN